MIITCAVLALWILILFGGNKAAEKKNVTWQQKLQEIIISTMYLIIYNVKVGKLFLRGNWENGLI